MTLRLTPDNLTRIRALLGEGKNVTSNRLSALFDELKQRREQPMKPDVSDIEHGRVPHKGRPVDPEITAQRLADQREAHLAMGLRPDAPALEDEAPGKGPLDPDNPQTPPHREPPTEPGDLVAVNPEEEQAEIARLKAGGLARTREVADALDRKSLQRMPMLKRSKLQTLDEAAEILFAELQPNHQDAIRQVTVEVGYPAWVVILGAVARMADQQELITGEFEYDWLNRTTTKTAAATKAESCEMCGAVIPNAKRGQKFCCSRHGSEQTAHNEDCPCADMQMIRGRWVKVGATA